MGYLSLRYWGVNGGLSFSFSFLRTRFLKYSVIFVVYVMKIFKKKNGGGKLRFIETLIKFVVE